MLNITLARIYFWRSHCFCHQFFSFPEFFPFYFFELRFLFPLLFSYPCFYPYFLYKHISYILCRLLTSIRSMLLNFRDCFLFGVIVVPPESIENYHRCLCKIIQHSHGSIFFSLLFILFYPFFCYCVVIILSLLTILLNFHFCVGTDA